MKRKAGKLRFAAALVLMAATIACIVGIGDAAWFLLLQPGPQWVRLATGAGAVGIILTVVLLVATFLFGRFFCAVLCPLGTCQDVVDLARSRRKTTIPDWRWLRYGVAVASLVLLAGGWAVLFRSLDPFSRFGAMLGFLQRAAGVNGGASLSSGMFWGGLLPLLLLAGLVVWKRRLYCVALCPVGTILGVAAKFGRWRMRMREGCVGCGRCDPVCPTGCIDSAAHSLDAERCVLCMRCVDACPNGSMAYASAGGSDPRAGRQDGSVDASRRRFLLVGAALVVGAAGIGRGLSGAFRSVARAAENVRNLILPPGAVDAERFVRQCTGCQVCAANCPAGIITPSPLGFGPVRLEYSHSGCEYDCTRCNTVCPSGALQPLALVDKQWLKIGEARIDLPKCRIVKDGIACGLCARVCPKEAIFMVDAGDGFDVPEVAAFHCIGCGQCQAVCPVAPKAIVVGAIEQQSM